MKKFNFKKTAASIAAFTLVLSAAVSPNASLISELIPVNSISASAATLYTSGDWKYTISNGAVMITDYIGTAASVTTPTKLGGYPVKSLGGTFEGNTTLRYVTISEGVEIIWCSVFENCTNLTKVTLPSTLKKIQAYAFKNSGLVSVTIPASVTYIAPYAFESSKLKNVTIKGTPEVSRAFEKTPNLERIWIDKKNISTFAEAFMYNKNLRCINNNAIIGKQSNGELYVNQTYIDIIRNLDENKYVNEFVLQEAERVVDEVTTNDMADYQKAKALHDWVCKEVDYDHDNKDAKKNHVDSSVFLNDSTVCDGYARGYALLLQAADIEAYVASGIDHAWNIVKLGDYSFHIDVCHDDETGNNFNLSHYALSDTDIKKCTSGHNSWKVKKPSSLYNYEDSVSNPNCFFSFGDINKDGKVNSKDSQHMLNYLTGNSNYYVYKANRCFSDMNFDGKYDICDVVILNKIISGNYNV